MNPANHASRLMIVTGDDFGCSNLVNRAIIEAHKRGILTTASLMVNGDAFEEAVALAHAHPRLSVGLHLVVICGRATLPAGRIPLLAAPLGRFSDSPVRAGLRYQFNRLAQEQLRLEIRAQLEKFHRTGLQLSHVDGHLHMHLHPVVLKALIDLAGEFGIGAIRLPGEELGMTLRLDRSDSLRKVIYSWVFNRLRLCGGRRLKAARIQFTDRVYGLLQTGRMTEEYLLGLIPKIRASRVEIYSHLSTAELEAYLSPRVRVALDASGFQLATYETVKGCMACESSLR